MSEIEFQPRSLPLGPLKIPGPGIVHLWFLDLSALASPLGVPGSGIPLRPRQERSVRRFYLRLLLGAYLGMSGKDVKISRLVRGKPVLDDSVHSVGIEFSSAGSDGCCLIGISADGSLGVDLELTRRQTLKPRSLSRRYFSLTEQEALDGVPEREIDRWFIHTWACKEALVKAAGLGIANQLNRFSVDTNPDRPPSVVGMDGDDAKQWSLAMVRPGDRFLGSVALRYPSFRIEAWNLLPTAPAA